MTCSIARDIVDGKVEHEGHLLSTKSLLECWNKLHVYCVFYTMISVRATLPLTSNSFPGEGVYNVCRASPLGSVPCVLIVWFIDALLDERMLVCASNEDWAIIIDRSPYQSVLLCVDYKTLIPLRFLPATGWLSDLPPSSSLPPVACHPINTRWRRRPCSLLSARPPVDPSHLLRPLPPPRRIHYY